MFYFIAFFVSCTLMNYLAHAYLSFNHPEILVGNMISDYIKGKSKFEYSIAIQKGIQLHRCIDTFTDTHPIIKEAKQCFQIPYRLYSGAFIDIVFDHFLAIHLQSEINFEEFVDNIYATLQKYQSNFPLPFSKMFPYMQAQNWLFNYQYKWAMLNGFKGLQKRAKYIIEIDTAYNLFEKEYDTLKIYFEKFWPILFTNTKSEFILLQNNSTSAQY